MAQIVVLGAGMIGVTSALALQAGGHDVTLIDRREPGRETSYGNAGIIQAEAAEPYGFPREFLQLLEVALGYSVAARWSFGGLLQMGRALLSYYKASEPNRHKAISAIYSEMTLGSTKDHEPLIKASGSDNLISKDGFYVLIRDERKFENMQARLDELLAEYGLASTLLDREQLQASVSGMRAAPVGAVHWPQSWRSRDPGALVSAYANLFKSRGGTIEQTDVSGIVPVADGWCLKDDFGRETTEHLVVALGPWSPKMLKPLGYHFPMIAKRGYHGHFAPEAPLGAVLVDDTNGVVATPMGETIRVTTGASFVRQSAPASYKQYEAAVAKIGEFAPLGKEEVARRPSIFPLLVIPVR